MKPTSNAPLSQAATPTAQARLVAQAKLAATPTTAKVPSLPPKDKCKVSNKAIAPSNNKRKFIAWDHFEKIDIGKGHVKTVCNYC